MTNLIPDPPKSPRSGGKQRGIKTLFPAITEHQVAQLQLYAESLKIWNRRVNLISRKDIAFIWEHHIYPSIVALHLHNIAPGNWIADIGSGGGFPAIPIKILRPDLQFVLIESVRKKALFLKIIIADLQLEQTTVLNQRVEDVAQQPLYRKKFDGVTARAVAPIPRLIEWGEPFLKNEGYFLLWKGSSDIKELKQTAQQFDLAYEIFSPPQELQNVSSKFKDLRLFILKKPS